MAINIKRTTSFSGQGFTFRGSGGGSFRVTQTSQAAPIVPDTITLTQGMTVTTVVADATYNYTSGDSVVLDSTYLDTSYIIVFGMFFFFGNTPVDLSTLNFQNSGLYDINVSGVSFYLDVMVPPVLGVTFTSAYGSQLITGGESVSFNPFAFFNPTVTTTLPDTSWSLVDQFSTPIANGTLPINNLKTLWINYSLSSDVPYTMTASGITFYITREGG